MEETVNVQELLRASRSRSTSRSAKVSLVLSAGLLAPLIAGAIWVGGIGQTVTGLQREMEKKADKDTIVSMQDTLNEIHKDVREIRQAQQHPGAYNYSSKP